LLLLVAAGLPAMGFAETTLMGHDELPAAIARRGYCCVVDARSPAGSATDPIAQSVPYRKGVKLTPTAAIVVIAETDADALRIGKDLERATGARDVIAVKGGSATWRAYLASVLGAPPRDLSFVIPRNTCESGEPLQQLRSGRP
jgi:hypothetical protein